MHSILHILAVPLCLALTACGSTRETSRPPEGDLLAFNRTPIEDHHVHADGPRAEEPPPPIKYTCPMHPEIVRDEPGVCPICKMKLVAQKPASDKGSP